MASSSFQFVQGNERLDWGVLVSIDADRLMKSTNVDTLQRIVENIAFSRITRDEAAMFTPDHILHLFHLCQVLIQYLVHSQEVLAKINVKLNDRMAGEQATVQEREALLQRLSDETSLLKKQVKAQRRTLLAYEYSTQAALARGATGSGATAGGSAASYICPYCGEEYHKAESMQSHLRKRHQTATAPAHQRAPETTTSSPSPAAGGRDGNYGDHPASPTPPAAGAQTLVPVAAGASIPSGGASESFQELRFRVEQLEKDKDTLERNQRESLILMMLGATRSQQPAPGPSNTGAPPPPSPPPPPPPSSSTSPLPGLAAMPSAPPIDTAVKSTPDSLLSIPVVPDISAMMNYNLSCQRDASENALRRQLVDLEAEVRALKANRATAASTVSAETTLSSSPQGAASDSGPLATPATSPSPGVVSSNLVSSVAQPVWDAKQESNQRHQLQQQQQQHPTSSISADGSSIAPPLAPPLAPPPAPLPPPPQVVSPPAPSPPPSHGNATGVVVPSLVQPLSDSQSYPTQNRLTLSVAAPISSLPSPSMPVPLQPSTPAPQPSSVTLQQLQQLQRAVPLPTFSASGLSTTEVPPTPPPPPPPPRPPSLPSTAPIGAGGAPLTTATTVTPTVGLPQPPQVHTKPHYWVDSSTSSSIASTSTAPPNRVGTKGPPIASLFHTGSSPSPSLAVATPGAPGSITAVTAVAAPSPVPAIPLPSATSAGSLVAPVSTSGAGIGSYFSSRAFAPLVAAPTLSAATPPPTTRDSITSTSSNNATLTYTYTAPYSTEPPAGGTTGQLPPPSVASPQPALPSSTSIPTMHTKNASLSQPLSSPVPVPVVAATGTGGNHTTPSVWFLPTQVSSTASVPVPAAASVPGAVRGFRPLSSSSSSSSD